MIFDSSTELEACEVPDICEAKNVPRVEQTEGVRDQDETGHRCRVFSENCENQAFIKDRNQEMGHGSTSGISIACKIESQLQRGMRRRCLNFEGVPEMGLQNDSTASHSNGAHPTSNILPVPFKAGNPSTCIVPGIGLHLNTLGLKDRFLSRETLVSGQRLISMPSPICPFHSTTGLEPHDKSLSVDKDLVTGSGIHNLSIMHDDVSQSSALISGKDLHQSSPKKKRRKLEIGAENREGCKRCNCKKSKCLKLYCECFAAGVFCAEPCSCQSCFNKPIHQETVLNTRKQIESRNPLAFAPKVIRPSDPDQEIGEELNKTPASARHKRGCNCKKSSCLKKYCECYQGGVGCSVSCRCEGCKNAFGRKDGSLPIEDEEFEQEEEQKDANLNVSDGLDAGEQSADPTNDELQYPESVLQLTPFQVIRPSMDLAILSSGQTPLSSSLTTVTSASFNSFATLRRFEMPLSQCKLGKLARVDSEDETPAILKGNVSPINSVKATSPNQKRVSPPQFGTRLSPNHKGGRKLILKSIPSFPSLNNDLSHEISANYYDSSLDMPSQS
ncbi:protein tesmin/TSO1-like CXC 2 isoform X1 [Dioscorea cayenensis subsp. rotundata]|uniref:Protein tesmin/TSO1-like CXC 2 isoform X1 n=1 Tax=Dioscorea cayennensis subsp. rotundata TaxID=55577 RepID=A0AB40BRS2_DIOCR|nr:protein tesmin/TSO1-like CXC 2 isoform X1 [Dioscorea cayenensis subsp. rotundata]XP_039130133.1 protein tesmin/TSO1-like CXC 2 isoform X1 [Dioscorea cayenensis subsp. rotundata]